MVSFYPSNFLWILFLNIGYLSLRALDKVHFTPLLLSTIPKFCPNLKEVVFCKTKEEESMEEESMEEEPMEEEPKEKNLGPGSFIEELVPPNDVVDYFKSWPKVKKKIKKKNNHKIKDLKLFF